MIKICFICTGNTCRSIMAERILKKEIKDKKIVGIKVSSRGLAANGDNIADNAKKALKKLKASSANRKSMQLKKVDKDTLYVTMTEKQKEFFEGANCISFKKLLGFDILDPYGKDEDVYNQTANQIKEGILILLEKLKTWRNLW